MSKQETKSPIKNLPMRQPVQSTREKVDKLIDDEIMPYFLAAFGTFIMSLFEWGHYSPERITRGFLIRMPII